MSALPLHPGMTKILMADFSEEFKSVNNNKKMETKHWAYMNTQSLGIQLPHQHRLLMYRAGRAKNSASGKISTYEKFCLTYPIMSS